MQRRDFLKQSIGAITAAGAATSGLANAMAMSDFVAKPAFDWHLGWKSVTQDSFSPLKMKVTGSIPTALNGAFFRNGPAKMERGSGENAQRYTHWFDGDGMVQKFSIHNGQMTHTGQFIHTQKYQDEEQAQRFLYNGAGSVLKNSIGARNNDSINTANTALQVWDEQLLALWEGGSAVQMNPHDLSTVGIKTWQENLAQMPFSAHPLVDKKGHMWNFGFAPYAGRTGKIVIYHIAPKTGLQQTGIIDLPFKGYMHDFAQTNESLIFLIPPYTFTKAKARTFVDGFEWNPSLGSRLLVVSKNDFRQQKWFELPAGFVFHFGHATQNKANLQVNLSWYENANLMQTGMTELMKTGQQRTKDEAVAATIVANLNTGKAKLVKSDTLLEFPSFDESMDHQDSKIFGVGHSAQSLGHADKLSAWQPYQGEVDQFQYAAGIMVEEPIFVSGYILQTFLDVGLNKQSGVNIFEANNLSAGPIAQASMKRLLPLGFHGTYMNAV